MEQKNKDEPRKPNIGKKIVDNMEFRLTSHRDAQSLRVFREDIESWGWRFKCKEIDELDENGRNIRQEEDEENSSPLSYERQFVNKQTNNNPKEYSIQSKIFGEKNRYVDIVASQQQEYTVKITQIPVIEGVDTTIEDFLSYLPELEEFVACREK